MWGTPGQKNNLAKSKSKAADHQAIWNAASNSGVMHAQMLYELQAICQPITPHSESRIFHVAVAPWGWSCLPQRVTDD